MPQFINSPLGSGLLIACAFVLIFAASCGQNTSSHDNASQPEASSNSRNTGNNKEASADDITNAEAADTRPRFDNVHRQNAGRFVFEATKPIHYVQLPAATGGQGLLKYSIRPSLPAGLAFDSHTRVLSGTASTVQASTTYTYTVADSDANTQASDIDSFTFTITVNERDTAPAFAANARITNLKLTVNTALPNAVNLPQATGGNGGAYVYTFLPELPQGLVFNAHDLTLTGTPTEAQAATIYNYKVADTDSNIEASDTNSLSFIISVTAPDASNSVPTLSGSVDFSSIGSGSSRSRLVLQLVAGQPGATLSSIVFPAARGGDGALRYSIAPSRTKAGDTNTLELLNAGSPTGLEFNLSTRQLSGRVTQALGPMRYQYKVEDSDDNTRPADTDLLFFSVEVLAAGTSSPPAAALQLVDTRDLELPAHQSARLSLGYATGGSNSYTYSLTSSTGALSEAMNFNSAQNELILDADLQAGRHTLRHSVTDSNGDTETQSFTITKLAPVRLPEIANILYDRRGRTDTTGATSDTSDDVVQLPAATQGKGPYNYTLKQWRFNDDGRDGRWRQLERYLAFDSSTRSLTIAQDFRGTRIALLYQATDTDGVTDYESFSLEPNRLLDSNNRWAKATACRHKYRTSLVSLQDGLSFHIHLEAQLLLDALSGWQSGQPLPRTPVLFQQAIDKWNEVFGHNAPILHTQRSLNVPVYRDDGISTLSKWGLKSPLDTWIAFERSDADPNNLWVQRSSDLVINNINSDNRVMIRNGQIEQHRWTPAELRNTLIHELGHSLGLGHSTNRAHIMYADNSGGQNGIHADEVRLIRCLYDLPAPSSQLLANFAGGGSGRFSKPAVMARQAAQARKLGVGWTSNPATGHYSCGHR